MPGAAAVAAGIGMLGLAVGMCAPAVALCEGDEAAGAGAQEASGSDGSSTDGNKKKERSLFSAEVLENAGLPNPGGFGDLKRSSKLQFQPFDGFVAELTKSFAGEEGQLQIAQKCVAVARACWVCVCCAAALWHSPSGGVLVLLASPVCRWGGRTCRAAAARTTTWSLRTCRGP